MPARKTTLAPQLSTPQLTRAAIYVRVSTEDQASEGFGLDVQRERCKAMATVKGWSIFKEYADEGISGTKSIAQRPALAQLLADVDAGAVDAVIILALDRLGRKVLLVLELVERLKAAGVKIISCKEQIDSTTPYGEAMLAMTAVFAQLEHGLIAQRTTDGRNARGLLDGEKGGQLPYGYVRGEHGPVVDETEAKTVRYILRNRRSGKSYQRIANELNEKGIPSARGGKWYAPAIKVICDNRSVYQGSQRGESMEHWPALL